MAARTSPKAPAAGKRLGLRLQAKDTARLEALVSMYPDPKPSTHAVALVALLRGIEIMTAKIR